MADVFVRAARLIDAGSFAAVQRRSWLAAAVDLELPDPPAPDLMERSWEKAVLTPPSDRHHTWVAVASSPAGEIVVGIAALAPAADPDLDPNSCLELLVLAVDPEQRGNGHGSRLLTAALQTATAAGEHEVVAWLASGDDTLRQFLESAGWAADGAHRTLASDTDSDGEGEGSVTSRPSQLRQLRLGTALEPSTP